MSDEPNSPLPRLLRRLDLEQRNDDVFIGYPGKGEGALFGGMVAAQSIVAAGRTVADRNLHSLHGYFLRPGRHGVPIRFSVDRIREGRTFSTRSVVARQEGEAIFNLSADFTRPEEGIAHQDPMPEAPPPDALPDWKICARSCWAEPRSGVPTDPLKCVSAIPTAPRRVCGFRRAGACG